MNSITPTDPATVVDVKLIPRIGPRTSGKPPCIPNETKDEGPMKKSTFARAVVTAAVLNPQPTVCAVERFAMIKAFRFAFAAINWISMVVETEDLAMFPDENGIYCTN